MRALRKEAFEDDELWLHGECITQAFKPMKMAIRVTHLVDDWKMFYEMYTRIKDTGEKLFGIKLSEEEIKQDLDAFMALRDVLIDNKLVADTVVLLNKEMKNQKRILVEDASSSSMDIDTGLYPFTDSFHTTTGAVCSGLGIPEDAIETQIGVFSAISVIRKGFLKRI